MSSETPRFQQPRAKARAGALLLSFQRCFPLDFEIALSKWGVANRAFSRMRDAVVSEDLRLVYFPVPKSACTLFSTFVAMSAGDTSDFDPDVHSIHSYRQQNSRLSLRDFSMLTDPAFFRFTVIREPYGRLVSAYVDKLVKPVRDGLFWGTFGRCGRFSFEDLVDSVSKLSDGELEKHFRPQITFIRNVPMDHVGLLEDLEITYGVLKKKFGVDIKSDVALKVKAPKRTGYQQEGSGGYIGHLTAGELAKLDSIPPVEAFYNDTLMEKVALRFKEDFDLYQKTRNQLKVGS